jgi:hypothetical protein
LDYLAAPVTLLKALHEERRALDFGRHELVKDILWASSPGDLFKLCYCIQQPDWKAQHHDPVQVLLPKGSKLFPRAPKYGVDPTSLVGSGAVVFGHNRYFKVRWPDSGGAAPVAGDLLVGDAELDTSSEAKDVDGAIASVIIGGSSDSSVRGGSLLTATTAAPVSSASSQLTEFTGATTPGEGEFPKPAQDPNSARSSRWSRRFFFKSKK